MEPPRVAPPSFSDGRAESRPANETPREGSAGRLNCYVEQTDEIASESLSTWLDKLGGFLAALRTDRASVVDASGNFQVARQKSKDGPRLERLPDGYSLCLQLFTPIGRNGKPTSTHFDEVSGLHVRRDAYLFGHPGGAGSRFRSPAEFAPHLAWLEDVAAGRASADDRTRCTCRPCKNRPASPPATSTAPARQAKSSRDRPSPSPTSVKRGATSAANAPAASAAAVPVASKSDDMRKDALLRMHKSKRKKSDSGETVDDEDIPLAKRSKSPTPISLPKASSPAKARSEQPSLSESSEKASASKTGSIESTKVVAASAVVLKDGGEKSAATSPTKPDLAESTKLLASLAKATNDEARKSSTMLPPKSISEGSGKALAAASAKAGKGERRNSATMQQAKPTLAGPKKSAAAAATADNNERQRTVPSLPAKSASAPTLKSLAPIAKDKKGDARKPAPIKTTEAVPKKKEAIRTASPSTASEKGQLLSTTKKSKKTLPWRKLRLASAALFARSDLVLVPVRITDARVPTLKACTRVVYDDEPSVEKHIWWPASVKKVMKQRSDETPADAQPEDVEYTYSYAVAPAGLDDHEYLEFEELNIRPALYRSSQGRVPFNGSGPETEEVNSPVHLAFQRATSLLKEGLDFKIVDLGGLKAKKEDEALLPGLLFPQQDLAVVWGSEAIKVGMAIRLPDRHILVIESITSEDPPGTLRRSATISGQLWGRQRSDAGKEGWRHLGDKRLKMPSKTCLGRFYWSRANLDKYGAWYPKIADVIPVDLTASSTGNDLELPEMPFAGTKATSPLKLDLSVPPMQPNPVGSFSMVPEGGQKMRDEAELVLPEVPSSRPGLTRIVVKPEPKDEDDVDMAEAEQPLSRAPSPPLSIATSSFAPPAGETPADGLLADPLLDSLGFLTGELANLTEETSVTAPPPLEHIRTSSIDTFISVVVDGHLSTSFVLNLDDGEAVGSMPQLIRYVMKQLTDRGVPTPELSAMVVEGREIQPTDLSLRFVSFDATEEPYENFEGPDEFIEAVCDQGSFVKVTAH